MEGGGFKLFITSNKALVELCDGGSKQKTVQGVKASIRGSNNEPGCWKAMILWGINQILAHEILAIRNSNRTLAVPCRDGLECPPANESAGGVD